MEPDSKTKNDDDDFKKRKPKAPKTTTEEVKEKKPEVDRQKRYIWLLQRIRKKLQENNPQLASKSKIVIKPPDIEKLTRKSIIKNFGEICVQLNRDQYHVMNFFLSELCAEGSLAIDQQNKKLSSFSKYCAIQSSKISCKPSKYIKEFVRCQPCGSPNTILEKDKQTRLEKLQCQACKATRRVIQIKRKG